MGNDKIRNHQRDVTISGGAGRDTLYCGDGKDIFIYKPGEGNDTIFDYESSDMLKILNANGSKGSYSGATFSGNKLMLSINGGGTVVFDGVSKGDIFKINGSIYKINGSTTKFAGIN